MPTNKTPRPNAKPITSLYDLPDEIREVFLATANIYRITPDKLWARTRKREIVDARHIAISIIYDNYGSYGKGNGYTLDRIGDFFNRDHTTIIHALQNCRNMRLTNDGFRDKYQKIKDTARIMAKRPGISTIIAIMDALTVENANHAEKWLRDLLNAQTMNTHPAITELSTNMNKFATAL